ncbi:unnamed protein product [Toxocara canis]|uniref:Uncharacterized protein n=1 Tax=Toxocara canis TaxID=6265 RepID=A0A3P7FER9_TOXCA|nr:unnamed protein product [Toxocara canis]
MREPTSGSAMGSGVGWRRFNAGRVVAFVIAVFRLDKKSGELGQLRKQVDDLRKQYQREYVELSILKDKLTKAETAEESERIKVTTLEKELAEAKARLNVKSTKDAELKCAHCAARIVIADFSSATAAVCDVRSYCCRKDVISAPSPEVVITPLPRKSSVPKNSGGEKLNPMAKPRVYCHSEEARVQRNASESNVTSVTEGASVMS